MNAQSIVSELKGKAGQHVRVTWQRIAKTLKDCPMVITKRTCAWVRSGITYANLADIREGIEAGTRGEVESLPWGQWRDGFRNYIIDHTPKGSTEPKEYIRLYPAVFDNLKTEVQWFMDGRPCEYADVEPYLKSNEKRKDDDAPLCFTVNASDVVEIG